MKRFIYVIILATTASCATNGGMQTGKTITYQNANAWINLNNKGQIDNVTPELALIGHGKPFMWRVNKLNKAINVCFKEASPCENWEDNTCRSTSDKQDPPGSPAKNILKCKIKNNAMGDYPYTVELGGIKLDPVIRVY